LDVGEKSTLKFNLIFLSTVLMWH